MSNDALADVFLILYGKVSVFVWDLGFRFLDLDHLLEIKFFLLGLWVTDPSITSTCPGQKATQAHAFLAGAGGRDTKVNNLGSLVCFGFFLVMLWDIKILSHFYI